jgi:hypothetical protein
MNQIIYILTNEAMPRYVKISKTSTSLEQRIRELSASTSVPIPFTCFYACTVKDMAFVERQLHDAFDNNRINPRREFFQIAPERVIAALKSGERMVGAGMSDTGKTPKNFPYLNESACGGIKNVARANQKNERQFFCEAGRRFAAAGGGSVQVSLFGFVD